MSVRIKLSVAGDIIRDYGWRVFLFRAVPWLLRRSHFVYAGRLVEQDHACPPDMPFHLEVVRPCDIGRVVAVRPAFYRPAIVAQRLEEGHLCFLGWLGRTPVHVRWLFTKPVFLPYVGRVIDLRPGEALSDESFTLRAFRHRGITGRAYWALGRLMPGLGFHRLIALVASWNTITIRLLEEHGLKRVGECGQVFRLWRRRTFVRGSVQEGEGRTIRVAEDRIFPPETAPGNRTLSPGVIQAQAGRRSLS